MWRWHLALLLIKLAEKSGLAARIYCDREAAPPVRTGAAGIFIKAGKAGWKISQPALPAFANYLNHLNFPGGRRRFALNRNVHCQASGTAGLSLLPARRLL
ncbi:hypothetical protein CLOLEP_00402 [[Clostridium] leptum DSM 753]|uniref:Uncharacterized protein n=1 Tax=[Clostridium] leptum DSM 753 TaxID=428125 RepID=A7VPC6_9FIRM|nr:hypothetical protein CLOLEP_00402 [[Clostridium] leptum DSM 753]